MYAAGVLFLFLILFGVAAYVVYVAALVLAANEMARRTPRWVRDIPYNEIRREVQERLHLDIDHMPDDQAWWWWRSYMFDQQRFREITWRVLLARFISRRFLRRLKAKALVAEVLLCPKYEAEKKRIAILQ